MGRCQKSISKTWFLLLAHDLGISSFGFWSHFNYWSKLPGLKEEDLRQELDWAKEMNRADTDLFRTRDSREYSDLGRTIFTAMPSLWAISSRLARQFPGDLLKTGSNLKECVTMMNALRDMDEDAVMVFREFYELNENSFAQDPKFLMSLLKYYEHYRLLDISLADFRNDLWQSLGEDKKIRSIDATNSRLLKLLFLHWQGALTKAISRGDENAKEAIQGKIVALFDEVILKGIYLEPGMFKLLIMWRDCYRVGMILGD